MTITQRRTATIEMQAYLAAHPRRSGLDRRKLPRPGSQRRRRTLTAPDLLFAACQPRQEPKVRAWALDSIATVLSWTDQTEAQQMKRIEDIHWFWTAGSWKPKAEVLS